MLLTASTTWYLEDMRQDHLWTFQCPTAMLRLSSSQRKRERLKTTTTTLSLCLSLLYLNLLPGMSVNDGIIEELPNSQKEEGGTMTKTMTAGNDDSTSRNWYDAKHLWSTTYVVSLHGNQVLFTYLLNNHAVM